MDEKLQKYYEDRFSMMATPGWTDLIEDVQRFFDSINKVLAIPNENDLFLRKGQLDVLNWILSLKETSEQAYEQLMSGDSSE